MAGQEWPGQGHTAGAATHHAAGEATAAQALPLVWSLCACDNSTYVRGAARAVLLASGAVACMLLVAMCHTADGYVAHISCNIRTYTRPLTPAPSPTPTSQVLQEFHAALHATGSEKEQRNLVKTLLCATGDEGVVKVLNAVSKVPPLRVAEPRQRAPGQPNDDGEFLRSVGATLDL